MTPACLFLFNCSLYCPISFKRDQKVIKGFWSMLRYVMLHGLFWFSFIILSFLVNIHYPLILFHKSHWRKTSGNSYNKKSQVSLWKRTKIMLEDYYQLDSSYIIRTGWWFICCQMRYGVSFGLKWLLKPFDGVNFVIGFKSDKGL